MARTTTSKQNSSSTSSPSSNSDTKHSRESEGGLKKTSPTAKRTKTEESNTTVAAVSPDGGKQIFVSKIRSGDMIMLMKKGDNAPYWKPTRDYMSDNPEFVQNTLGIDKMHNRRHPQNPSTYLAQLTNGYNRYYPVFTKIVGDEDLQNNTPETRRNWANTFIHFHNHHRMQMNYRYPEDAHFAGDITPQDETRCPPLSDYCTIKDTMDCMTLAYANCHIGQIINDAEAMTKYFSPTLHNAVRDEFLSYVQEWERIQNGENVQNDGNNNPFHATNNDFGIPPFQMG